jgi:hypothetical protein
MAAFNWLALESQRGEQKTNLRNVLVEVFGEETSAVDIAPSKCVWQLL